MPRPRSSAPSSTLDRRSFLGIAATLAGPALATPALAAVGGPAPAGSDEAPRPKSPNERPVVGIIGAGIRFHEIGPNAMRFGPAAALADPDFVQLGRGLQRTSGEHYAHGYSQQLDHYRDYRRVLDRDDIDVVVIASPDHWHAKHLIEAMHAGKDVYCEKPLTYSIGEGRKILDAIASTGRVVQVGSQQRTEFEGLFAKAAAMIRDGRVGRVRRITCALGTSDEPLVLPKRPAPPELDWDLWQGPAPEHDYREGGVAPGGGYGAGYPLGRGHVFFRWWYEYSGGKMTDWGVHHVDIALWALNPSDADFGPYRVEPLMVDHPVPMAEGVPTQDDRFNTARAFHARVTLAGGVELNIRHDAPELGFDNGILFEGDKGRLFVNRGKLTGKPVEELKERPLPADALERLYGRPAPASHMADFMECVATRRTPISDVASHCRHLNVCHSANIALRLGREVTFDPSTERFQGDEAANQLAYREPRKGYEIAAG